MQTFLPYEDFQRSASVLDRQRLGKQRVETLQILTTLLTGRKAWSNHPATRMWRGYESSLMDYGSAICAAWVSRGYRDTCYDKMRNLFKEVQYDNPNGAKPAWLGDEALHASHRSNLMRKSEHYHQFGWTEPHSLEYIWPV